jgi:hypothetical protein
VSGSTSARAVSDRSRAEIPVVVPCRSLSLGVALHHERQVELVGPFCGERGTDQARRVAHEERHGLRRGVLRGDDEIALVLTVLVVDDDHHPA